MTIVLTLKVGLVLVAVFLLAGIIENKTKQKKLMKQDDLLDYAQKGYRLYQQEQEEEDKRKEEEEKRLKNRKFTLNCMVTHGTAFGGFSAILPDGRTRRGKVSLSEIMMHGTHPSGGEFTYYIEDQGIEICASTQPEEMMIRAVDGHSFEIREAGKPRDKGLETERVLIRKNILYYIILESKHELSVRAVECV